MNRIIALIFFSLQILTFSVVLGNSISRTKCNVYQSMFPPMSKTFNDTDEDSASKQFPYMARIYNNNGASSNGILISENFVLTIANNSRAGHIILGDLDHSSKGIDSHLKRFEVIKEIKPPDFHFHQSHTIKLLKLNESVQFDEYVRPACLSQPKSIISQPLIEIGWSETLVRDNKHLHKVKLNFMSTTTCKKEIAKGGHSELYTRGIDDGTHFCAAVEKIDQDMCPRVDSAALLNDDHEIVGIASKNNGCGEGHPHLFVRVSEYIPWIESFVWPRENELIESTTDIMETATDATDTEYKVIETTSEVEASVTNVVYVERGPTEKTITTTTESPHSSKTSEEDADGLLRKIIFIVMLCIVFILLCVCAILLLCIQMYMAKNRQSVGV